MEFLEFKKRFEANAESLLKDQTTVYVVNLSGDELWQGYIDSFPEDKKQEYTCNSCRSFIKHYGGLVAISPDFSIKTIWDFEAGGYYEPVRAFLQELVLSAKIRDKFVVDTNKLGTDSNAALLPDGAATRWQHLFINLPQQLVTKTRETLDTVRSQYRDSKNVFKRSLEELTIDSTETVLELIGQNSLYRGTEFKPQLAEFLKVQKEYKELDENKKDNYTWKNASNVLVSRIRNTALGTLLIDLSNDVELDKAVRSFERVMAPTNYKRPTALVTQKTIENAQKEIESLDLVSALGRRFAHYDDIRVNNVLFVDRSSSALTSSSMNMFDSLKSNIPVNPKTLSKTETITLEDFINNVLPNSSTVEVLLENRHEPNLVSMIAPVDPDAGQLFKWPNNFSWSYNNALTDSLKEKVKQAGGNVEGQLRASLEWFNRDDLDIHLEEPDGTHIYYANQRPHNSKGTLDVDINIIHSIS